MNFGSINIVFSDPISLKQYTQDYKAVVQAATPDFDALRNQEHRKELMHTLSYNIIHILNKNIVITPTAIVSTVLLTYLLLQICIGTVDHRQIQAWY